MASNYKNSAGTDLDNLFYIDNRNSGALGFRISDGTDLGNRYTSMSTLGYSLGFLNSAGTDIGYLRGKLLPPASASNSVSLTRPRYDRNGGYTYEDTYEITDSEGNHIGWDTRTETVTGARIYFNLNISSNTTISDIRVQYRITSSYVRFDGTNYYKFYDNHNLVAMTGSTYPSRGSYDGTFWDGYAGVFKTLDYNGVNTSNWSHNFGLVCIPYGWYHCNFVLRCDCTLTNPAGSTTVNSNTYHVNFDQM